jgi:hypothetical protein
VSATAPVRRPTALRFPTQSPPPGTPQRKPPTSSRPRLVLVSQRRPTAGRLPFVILVGVVLVGGLVGVLLLHTVAAQDAYRANTLQQRLATLTDQEQRLSTLIESDSSPQALRHRAVALGMVPTTVGKFHKVHDGRTVGVQTPVYVAPPAPIVTHHAASAGAKKHSAAAKTGKAATKTGKAATKTGKAGATGTRAPKHHPHHTTAP